MRQLRSQDSERQNTLLELREEGDAQELSRGAQDGPALGTPCKAGGHNAKSQARDE